MVKAVFISHGNIGKEFIEVAETILNQKIDVQFIPVKWESEGGEVITALEKFLQLNRKNNVIIFTDMFGGSPFNLTINYCSEKVEIISGINLPGFLKFCTAHQKAIPFQQLITEIKDACLTGFSIASIYLGAKK